MSKGSNKKNPHPLPPDTDQWHNQALDLVRCQRTLVLATSMAKSPWAAAVYYVYVAPGFYFFSSPKARHVQQTGKIGQAAATVYADSDQWENIQGLQMSGHIEEVGKRLEQLNITGHYLVKFPFAAKFLSGDRRSRAEGMNLKDKVRLYAFIPDTVYYMNNRVGFGRREAIKF